MRPAYSAIIFVSTFDSSTSASSIFLQFGSEFPIVLNIDCDPIQIIRLSTTRMASRFPVAITLFRVASLSAMSVRLGALGPMQHHEIFQKLPSEQVTYVERNMERAARNRSVLSMRSWRSWQRIRETIESPVAYAPAARARGILFRGSPSKA